MAKDTSFHKKTTLNAGGKLIDLNRPKVMGIINLTPDSFYAGSRKQGIDDALQQARRMLDDGADLLDLGAYSSRPGAEDISIQEETDRLLPVVETIIKQLPEAVLSIDTFRSQVAEAAIKAGAHIINDISGGQLDEDMFATVARLQAPYILMHMKGTPKTMNQLAVYDDVFAEVYDYFAERYYLLKQLGIHDVILDPGFGFAKKPEHGYALMNRLQDFAMLGLPVLAGVSRKKMIYGSLGITANEALNGTTALNTIALTKGADILRVHDVKEAVQAIKIWELCR
ncbi:dihydropteroate synthase [Mucilaginibacter sp. L3T2-6]|uniref:dihydropteroate synthase n=1 Tax=Mucilaginibacter sp. L3T2-6 TaxID=3062491 RepID=UPI0026753464|nr:dihydropteroate synthase [Mucilaginibacter sp. L3T2-6]MDO3641595.1 dihydropteroate synthase [Mucilaginibacter sp. L3T2-6]MDV6214089.1 dihydropteroate synthase [Mucilaginibacter sp. L3T2-6]